MYYQIDIKRTVMDNKGNDRSITEKYITMCELLGEAEMKGYTEFNGECDVTAVKRLPNLREFVNERSDESGTYLYLATLEDKFVNDDGEESAVKYNVIVYAQHINEANVLLNEYLKQGMNSIELVGVKRTKFVDLI